MTESRWTREALQARMAASDALSGRPAASAARAILRLELLDIIRDVDAGVITPQQATTLLGELRVAISEAA